MASSAYTHSKCWLQVLVTDEDIDVIHYQVLKCTQRVLYPNQEHYSFRNLESTNQPGFSRERISCICPSKSRNSHSNSPLGMFRLHNVYLWMHWSQTEWRCILYAKSTNQSYRSDSSGKKRYFKAFVKRRTQRFLSLKREIFQTPALSSITTHHHPSHHLNKKRTGIRTLSEVESVFKWLNELTWIHRGCFPDTSV